MLDKYVSLVAKRDFASTQDTTDGDVIASIVIGSIRMGKDPKVVSGNSKFQRKFRKKYFGSDLKIPVYHCPGKDSKVFCESNMKNIGQYKCFSPLFYSVILGGRKIVAIPGFYPHDLDFKSIIQSEKSCDILIFNSMVYDGLIQFPPILYEMVGTMKPELIVFGDVSKTKAFEFPKFQVKSLMIGYNAHVLYNLTSQQLYKKID